MTLSTFVKAAALLLLMMATCSLAHEPEATAFLITQESKPVAVILTADTPSAGASEAVAELNDWLEKITGTRLPIMRASAWDGKTPYIAVGASPLTEANGWNQAPWAQEEARVFIEPERIGLLGNDASPFEGVEWRGSYYAVLEFVRRSLGAYWIWPGPSGEVYQKQATLRVKPAQWQWKPSILLNRTMRNSYRFLRNKELMESMQANLRVSQEQWQSLSQEHDQWLMRQRMNRSSNARFGHAFHHWWARYGKTHPDWFARPPEGVPQLGGVGVKLNLSNPQVQEKIFNDWLQAWKKDPANHRYLNVAPNDSRGFDTRPESRAWDAERNRAFSDKEIFNGSEPVLSDRYVRFWNLLARRIREVDPAARLTTYAYRNYRTPPLDGARVEDNVIICYVGGEGYYPDERFILDEWRQWRALGATLCWRPNFLNAGHGTPYQYTRQLHEDFATLAREGIMGTDFDALTGNWSGNGLTYYVLAEQHSRPEASYETLSGEYFAAFGPGAEAIRRYHDEAEALSQQGPALLRKHQLVTNPTWGGWWKAYVRLIPRLFPPEALAQLEAPLKAAESAVEKSGSEVERQRVAVIRRGWEHTRLMAEAFGRLGLQDPHVDVRHTPETRAALEALWKFRLAHLVDLATPTVTLFMEEQRQLGLWSDFLQTNTPGATHLSTRLREGWQAQLDPQNHGLAKGWEKSGPPTPKAVSVGIPWRRALPDGGEAKVIWYTLALPVPALSDAGDAVKLRFGAVDAEMKLWINGKLVAERGYPHAGNYDSWNESFTVDLSRHVKPGEANQLVMRVESESQNAGITGPVFLLLDR